MLAALFFCGIARGAIPVRVDFFYEPGCHSCEQIATELLPQLKDRFPGVCTVQEHDIGVETNFLYLLQMEHALGYTSPERAYLIVNGRYAFGPSPSHEEFFVVVSNLLKQGTANLLPENGSPELAEKWFGGFTVPAVAQY